jgi:hypothetical protein
MSTLFLCLQIKRVSPLQILVAYHDFQTVYNGVVVHTELEQTAPQLVGIRSILEQKLCLLRLDSIGYKLLWMLKHPKDQISITS